MQSAVVMEGAREEDAEDQAQGRSEACALPFGAQILSDGRVRFRVWAPGCQGVEVLLEGRLDEKADAPPRVIPMDRDDGYFSVTTEAAGPGSLYRYRLDGGQAYPDPASRFQPEGPHGPSMVVDPMTYSWNDQDWKGLTIGGQVL